MFRMIVHVCEQVFFCFIARSHIILLNVIILEEEINDSLYHVC